MKKKKRRKLKAKLQQLKKAYRTARKARKAQEKRLVKARKQENKALKTYEALLQKLQPTPPMPEDEAAPSPSGPPNDPLATDNLREIPGLGAKFEQLLHRAGITTFAQLYAMQQDEWEIIFAQAGTRYRNFDPTPWQEEAARLANLSQ
ncbi:MAG: hypothetical protein KDC54_07350 [Lewinella sp.]|nr:hypothetical protein [Lewinella sp.]